MQFLQAEGVVKAYANHLALDKVSISVPQGQVFGLLGPNGAGKTTLIRIINRITAPDEGKVTFNGEELNSTHLNQIGYLPEERGLYKKMKVGEQAMYLARPKGLSKSEALEKLKWWFRRFEIQTWWDKKVEELSKGMQQKVQFIVTVLHEPKLLIFDEPFSGFDPINANLLKQEILALKEKGATIIFSTHNMSSVEEVCDNIALINNSKVILEGNVDEVKGRFKQHVYEVKFNHDLNATLLPTSEKLEIIDQSKLRNITTVKVKMQNGHSPVDLVSAFSPAGDIIGFNEVIPSMNDVFIQVVEESKQNANSSNL